MAETGSEVASVPEWLIKLESRREQIKGKLGHESGNGAPCIVCGTKCPGLDLHFWRKVCRNCKCRKEHHDCKDDVITGWAQFEILGAIRSKPAYIKISELTDKPVELDWIPPNVTADLASDYMSKIGEQNIPIVGSNAAKKRKQQLEYQVPPHDLDATLCHNLSENEATQLVQYVEKIRKNCVGQGNVVRIGDKQKYSINAAKEFAPDNSVSEMPAEKKLLNHILGSEPIRNALLGIGTIPGQQICIQNEPMEPDFNASPYLSDKMKYKLKLMKVNSEAIRTAVEQGEEIDQVINALNSQNVSFENSCNIMGPLYHFRQEYLNNPRFQAEVNKYLNSTAESQSNEQQKPKNTKLINNLSHECLAAVKKDKILSNILNSDNLQAILQKPVYGCILKTSREPLVPNFSNSPLLSPPTKTFLEKIKINSQVVQSAVINGPLYDELLSKLDTACINYAQDPVLQPIDMFRDKFVSYDRDNGFQKEITDFVKNFDLSSFGITADQVPDIVEATKAAQCKNPILSSLLSNAALQDALQYGKQLSLPLESSSNIPTTPELLCTAKMTRPTFEKLADMNIGHQVLESAVICGPLYDQLLQKLNTIGTDVAADPVLDAISKLRNEYLNDEQFRKDLARYIVHPEPVLFEPATIEEIPSDKHTLTDQMSKMHISHSDDSGFGSVPPTPNYSTHPGFSKQAVNHHEYPVSTTENEQLSSGAALENENFASPIRTEINSASSASPTNPISQAVDCGTCSGCSQQIVFGEVVVKAERVGSEAAWHPQCFKCHKCDELLADLVYFFHGGQVYCGRDLAHILKIPRCSACDELIFTKEYTAAEGATFHIKHFCCYHCDAPLAGQQYVPDENTSMPLCLQCYDTYFAKVCHYCKATIGPSEQGVAWGRIDWHGSCFLCSGIGCGKSLIGGRFCVKNDMPFCSPQCLKSVQF